MSLFKYKAHDRILYFQIHRVLYFHSFQIYRMWKHKKNNDVIVDQLNVKISNIYNELNVFEIYNNFSIPFSFIFSLIFHCCMLIVFLHFFGDVITFYFLYITYTTCTRTRMHMHTRSHAHTRTCTHITTIICPSDDSNSHIAIIKTNNFTICLFKFIKNAM